MKPITLLLAMFFSTLMAQPYLANGGFEEGWTKWKHESDPGFGQLTKEAAHSGDLGLEISDTSDGKGSEIFAAPFAVEPGKKLTLSFWGRLAAGEGAGVFLRFWDQGHKDLEPSKNFVPVRGKIWARQSGTFTVPPGAVTADLYVRSMLKAVCTVHLDEIDVQEAVMANEKLATVATAPAPQAPASLPDPVLLPENPAWQGQHPRLLLTRDQLPLIQARIGKGGEVGRAWKELISRCDKQLASEDPLYLAKYEKLKSINTKAPGGKGAYEGYFANTGIFAEMFSFAYLLTRDKKYGDAAIQMMKHIAVNYPVLDFPGFFYTRSFFLRGAAVTYDSCYDLMAAEDRALFRRTIATWARVFYERSPREIWETWADNTLNQVWNWNAGISGVLGLACLSILDETDEPVRPWLFQATRQVENFWRFAVDRTGGAVEGPAYIGYGAAPTPYFIEALRRTTGEDLFETTHYQKVGAFFPHEVLPSGARVLNISDSGYTMAHWQVMLYALHRCADKRPVSWCYQSLGPALGGQINDNLVALVLWGEDVGSTGGWAPDLSYPPFAWSPWRGVMISRTGWKPQDAFFTMHAQQYTLIRHDQVDKGQVNFFALGEDFLIDSGYGNDGGMLMSQGAGAHNIVLVDGKGPPDTGVHARTSGYLRDHLHSAAADFGRADLKDAWEYVINDGYQKSRVGVMKKAQRHALFARGPMPYLVVYEDLALDDKPHRYGVQWHTAAANSFTVGKQGVFVKRNLDGTRYPFMAVQPYQTKLDGSSFSANAPVAEAGEMRITLNLPREQPWQIWALTKATGVDGGKSDSVFFNIDGGKAGFDKGSDPKWFAWKTATDGLVWTALGDNNGTAAVPPLNLSKGPHELCFKTREEGAAILAVFVAPANVKKTLDEMMASGEGVLALAKDFALSGPVKLLPSGLSPVSAEAYLHVVSPSAPVYRQESFLTTRDGSHPRLTGEVTAASPDLLWALVPYRLGSGFVAPERVKTMAITRGVGMKVELPDGVVDIACRWDGKGIGAEGFETDGRFFWLRRDGKGKTVAWTMAQATSLKSGGKTLFECEGEEVSAVYDGSRVDISARKLVSFACLADTAECFVNGISVASGNKGPLTLKFDSAKQRSLAHGWSETLY